DEYNLNYSEDWPSLNEVNELSLNSKRNSAGETMIINNNNNNSTEVVSSSSSSFSTPSSPNIIAQNYESKGLTKTTTSTVSTSSSQSANTINIDDKKQLSNDSSLPNGVGTSDSPIQDDCVDDGSTTSSKDNSSGQGLDSCSSVSDKTKNKKKG
ncbi:hypothetical protein BLA29_011308, partial [Euroglyphus maynei]